MDDVKRSGNMDLVSDLEVLVQPDIDLGLDLIAAEWDQFEKWVEEHQTPTYTKDSRAELECLFQCYSCKNMFTKYIPIIFAPQVCRCGSSRVQLLRYERIDY